MKMRNKHDRDPEWEKVSYPTQEDIIEFNRKENKIKERIIFLQQQIAAGNRLDGYVLDGHKKELKKLTGGSEKLK
tara:strand:+ start:523 stop:747 length:225 start_codon:yes stop_codon:yes gene_type:complete